MTTEWLHRSFWNAYGRFAWDHEMPPIKKRVIRNVVESLRKRQESPGELVLDAGCGTGHYALALAEAGFLVTGIDYSSGMLLCAASKITPALSSLLSFHQSDMNKPLRFPDSNFHHVISISTLWTVADPIFTLKEMLRVLKPGGTVIIVQVPKPSTTFRQAVSNRLKHMSKKNLGTYVLIAAKVFLERTRATKYWSPEELLALMLANKELKISHIDHGPPIFVVGTKKLD